MYKTVNSKKKKNISPDSNLAVKYSGKTMYKILSHLYAFCMEMFRKN